MSKEFIIENLADLTKTLTEIKSNFEKEEPENIIVRFKDIVTQNDLLESLKQLWQFEIDSEHTIDILVKNLSYDLRKEALRLALKTSTLRDPIFLANIFCLIKGYNTFDESYFEHEQVFLNDEVEFLDIFDDLEEEIKIVTLNMAEYYVSMLKTCNLTEAVENNPNAVKLDFLYEYLFGASDTIILAKILSSVHDSSIWETKKVVLNSLTYLGMIAEKFVFASSVLNILSKEILEKSIKDSITDK